MCVLDTQTQMQRGKTGRQYQRERTYVHNGGICTHVFLAMLKVSYNTTYVYYEELNNRD